MLVEFIFYLVVVIIQNEVMSKHGGILSLYFLKKDHVGVF